jgi:hypothetical protein
MRRHVRHFGGRAKRHDASVKRAVLLLLMPLVATVSIGCGSYASAGAATSHPSQFCTSLKPGVKASQQLAPIVAGMSSHTVAKTKFQLLTVINTIRTRTVQSRFSCVLLPPTSKAPSGGMF